MIEELEKFTVQGRKYGASSYNVSSDFLLDLLNRLKTNEATIKKLQELLRIERMRDLK